jgi:hypothetical protein
MPDREFWRFVNTFAPWGSALASTAAVITALYLARRGDRIRIKVQCGIRILVAQGDDPGTRKQYVFLEATKITNLFWTARLFNKRQMVWIAPQNAFSHKIPTTLPDGETANWMTELSQFDREFADVATEDARTRFGAWNIRAGIVTSTGKRIAPRIEKSLRDHLRELARKQARQP